MTSTAKPHNIDWINNLRFVALFAVIVTHVSSVLLDHYPAASMDDWLTADAFNALVRFAVPVFVMITGTLLLNREYRLGDFLKKRLTRVVVPFLFWSLVYVAYSWYNGELKFTGTAWQNTKLVLHQLQFGASYHLWYVYMLIGLYLVIPIIGKFVRSATEKELLYFMVIWLLVMLLNQPWLQRLKPVVELRYFEGYIGYLVLGHYFNVSNFGATTKSRYFFAIALLMVMVITAGTWWQTSRQHSISTMFYEPLGPFVAILSAATFLGFKNSHWTLPNWLIRLRDFSGTYSYGMYLGHALVLYFLAEIGSLLNDVFPNVDDNFAINYTLCAPIISIPVTTLVCFAITLPLIWAINKIPVVGKWISG